MTIATAKRNEYFEAQNIPFMNYKHTLDPQGGLKSKIHPHSSPDVLGPIPKKQNSVPGFLFPVLRVPKRYLASM